MCPFHEIPFGKIIMRGNRRCFQTFKDVALVLFYFLQEIIQMTQKRFLHDHPIASYRQVFSG